MYGGLVELPEHHARLCKQPCGLLALGHLYKRKLKGTGMALLPCISHFAAYSTKEQS